MRNGDTEPSVPGGSEPADPPGRAGLVATELVRAQYRNIPTAVAVNAIISGLLCFALRDTVSPERLGCRTRGASPRLPYRLSYPAKTTLFARGAQPGAKRSCSR